MPRAAHSRTRHGVPVLGAAALVSAVAACGTSPAPAKPAAPLVTSAATAAFVVGRTASFPITTSAARAARAKVTETGRLPAGLTFRKTKHGAMLTGMPAAGTAGDYSLTIKVRDSDGHTAQLLALTVMEMPAFRSHPSITVTAGNFTTTSVGVIGFPSATVTEAGALPAGLQFKVLPNGTAVISGTPVATGGTVTTTVTLTAANTAGSVSERIGLTIFQPAPPPAPVVAPPNPDMGIPQGDGGDHDADNNGGFNDGDGDI